ncbi:hypothetical protein FRC12_000877 [Ceratobasidium sp. 428]|nr:hypothetical protein FRC12_000877 [Ceratobasidium sp. 428]
MYLPVFDMESTPNQERLVADQDPAQTVAVGNPIPENGDNAAHPPVQAMIQGPNQGVLNPAQIVPPMVGDTSNAALPGPAQPTVLAPEPALLLVVIPPVANNNPAVWPLMRGLSGFLNISVEEGGEEEEEFQDDDGEA